MAANKSEVTNKSALADKSERDKALEAARAL